MTRPRSLDLILSIQSLSPVGQSAPRMITLLPDRLGIGPRAATRLCGVPTIIMAIGLFAFAPLSASAQTMSFTPSEESPEQFPAGPGREETFYACIACHNFKLIAAQGMSRSTNTNFGICYVITIVRPWVGGPASRRAAQTGTEHDHNRCR
jgi:hypothetical protein